MGAIGHNEFQLVEDGNVNITWKACLKIGVTALAVYLCVRYWDVAESFVGLLLNGLLAIFAGLVIAYVVNIPMRFFERTLPGERGDGTRNRALAMALAIACIVVVLLLVLVLVIPQLVAAVVTLARDASAIIEALTGNNVTKSVISEQLLSQIKSVDWQKVVSDAAGWLQSGIVSSMPQIMSLFGRIGACFMGVVFAFWFLAEKDALGEQFHRLVRTYVGKGADERIASAAALADRCFHNYIVAQVLEATIFGSLVAVGAGVCGVADAAMLGALVGAMSLIPMVGALIGAILGALMILVTSWQQALVFLAVFFVAQQIEANFLYARVVGKHVGLTGMWPLIGVTLGGALFGIAGAFVGVPLTAAIFRIAEADLARREQLPDNGETPLKKLQKRISD